MWGTRTGSLALSGEARFGPLTITTSWRGPPAGAEGSLGREANGLDQSRGERLIIGGHRLLGGQGANKPCCVPPIYSSGLLRHQSPWGKPCGTSGTLPGVSGDRLLWLWGPWSRYGVGGSQMPALEVPQGALPHSPGLEPAEGTVCSTTGKVAFPLGAM